MSTAVIIENAEPTRLMLVGELGHVVGLANEMVRGTGTRIGVGAAPPAVSGLIGAEEDLVSVDLAIDMGDVLTRLRGGRSKDLGGASVAASISGLVGHNIADVERELILQTLRECSGNRSAAATILGISVRTIRNKLRAFQAEGLAVPGPCAKSESKALAAL